MNYNFDRENSYKIVRFCISEKILLEVAEQMEINKDMDLDQLAKISLEEKMEKEGYFKVEEK